MSKMFLFWFIQVRKSGSRTSRLKIHRCNSIQIGGTMLQKKYKTKGLRLIKKGQRGISHAIFSRFGLFLLLLFIQLMFLFGLFQRFEDFLPHILGGRTFFIFVMVICLLNSRLNPTAKITWLIVIMLLPVFGILLFLYTQSNIGHRALKKWLHDIIEETKEIIPQEAAVMESLDRKSTRLNSSHS